MLDRKIAPQNNSIKDIQIPLPELIITPNGLPLYVVNMGEQEVVRIDFMFNAGKWDQQRKLTSVMTNLMLKEGAVGMTSSEIAENLDYYGAWLQPSSTYHNSYVALYSLNKHFEKTISILEKIIKYPDFPKEEFSVIIDRQKQQFIVDREKVSILASDAFSEQMFGPEHPYGRVGRIEAFYELSVDDLASFHKKYYHSRSCRIMLTGRVNQQMINRVIELFGMQDWGTPSPDIKPEYVKNPSAQKEFWIERTTALQSAVRIGLPLIDRSHPDYLGLRVLNTVLGGYFGSRLMSNIREDKGYTYGIASSITTQPDATFLCISTQTANEFTKMLIDEVFVETERLKKELVGEEELCMIQNYLMGDMARLFDGPFSIADAHLSLFANNLDVSYYYNQINKIKEITSEELLDLAKRYFIRENFYIVVAGHRL